MISLLLIASLLAAPPCPHPARSRSAVAAFRSQNPCPGGKDKGSKKRCEGYVVDHICPLDCCGIDNPKNMQWQTVAEGKKKDQSEKVCSRYCRQGVVQ